VLAGLWLLPVSPHVIDGAALVWPAALVLGSLGLRNVLDRDSDDVTSQMAAQRDRAVARAYRRGQERLRQQVEQAAAATRRRLAASGDALAPAVAGEITRRLDQVDMRLADLQASAPATDAD
jgi:hypothetical protein